MLRRRELDTLKDLYDTARNECGRIALVRGPTASGKTSLVSALGEYVRSEDGRVAIATGSQAEQHMDFGAVEQLLAEVSLPRGIVDQALAAEGTCAERDRSSDPGCSFSRALYDAMSKISIDGGATVCVDDAHLVDGPSLECLTYLARRLREFPILLVLTISDDVVHQMSELVGEMERLAHYQGISLELLTRHEVLRSLSTMLDRPVTAQAAADAYAISGGNVLMLAGLADDLVTDESGPVDSAVPTGPDVLQRALQSGRATCEAILSIARRADPVGVDVMQALAVIGTERVDVLPAVSGIAADRVTRVTRSLRMAGLLGRDNFQHPLVRQAIVDSTFPDKEQEIHLRAAEVLHATAADERLVADHLLAAGRSPQPWGEYVLYPAAEAALSAGDTATALRCLTLVSQSGDLDNPAGFLRIATRMEWWKTESDAEGCLNLLLALLRSDRFPLHFLLRVARQLLAHGRVRDVLDMLARLSHRTVRHDQEAAEVRNFVQWLRVSYPSLVASLPAAATAGADAEYLADPAENPADGDVWNRSCCALRAALSADTDDKFVTWAAEILRGSRTGEAELDPIEKALTSLVYRDRLDLAAPWCQSLLDEAKENGSQEWYAILAGIRSEIAQRRGDFHTAVANSAEALADIPLGVWGVRLGLPLASRINGLIAIGDSERAGQVLKLDYPQAMLQTRYGLHYLQARGHYHLAVGNGELALRDFLACGELMTRWDMDSSTFLPWRYNVAETLVSLGDYAGAREAIEAQLDRVKGHSTRIYASSLRLWAATVSFERRQEPLEKSAYLLENYENKFEYARSLAALGKHYYSSMETRQAEQVLSKARQLARESGAQRLVDAVDAFALGAGLAVQPSEQLGRFVPEELSDAERRVADLVVEGCTNRQISERLFITQSTVSQHLTRIYRKMKVTHRGDLVRRLRAALPRHVSGTR
ncbi:AAA family ATPase [Streptomyces sp. NPDC047315]|uniref:LuxR C-terminal-related transcriptional regulator n=1 Tax=Streptomyces sp. NPDC047315 TaxID=3155142 RepID=UPI0033F25A3B